MDISVPSRFACLKLEDEEFRPVTSRNKKKNDKQPAKRQEKGRDNDSAKKNPKQQVKKEKVKKKEATKKQWEEWMEKDTELVNGHFEKDLQNAILLSKLEFEEKKEVYKQMAKDNDKKNEGKKKKTKIMSLEQFLAAPNEIEADSEELPSLKKENFFDLVQIEAKDEIAKEKISERRKERQLNIEEIITIAQLQEKLEKECQKNEKLEEELHKFKLEIKAVKTRNKTLCGILGHGEMKDKADVLLELERLNIVKNELTDEVTKLHGLLEQERSKVANLMTDLQHQNKHKDKRYKKHAINS